MHIVTSLIINAIIIAGVIASFAGVVLYVLARRHYIRNHTQKKGYIIGIGLINGCIGLLMAATVVISLVLNHTKPGIIFNTSAEFGGIAIIFIFIIAQSIYLFTSNSPIRQQLRQTAATTNQSSPPEPDNDKSEASPSVDYNKLRDNYLKKVSSDDHIALMQILGMSYPLRINDVYIPVKVDTKPPHVAKKEETQQYNSQMFLSNEKSEEKKRTKDASDALKAIGDHKYCILLGDPGIGKTTLLKYIALNINKNVPSNGWKVPVYLNLNRFITSEHINLHPARNDCRLFNFITNEMASGEDKNYLTNILNETIQGVTVLLLLDGLDETYIELKEKNAKNNYDTVCEAIMAFARQYRRTHIVVTSRRASYELYQKKLTDPTGKDFFRLYMLGFLEEDTQIFIGKWFGLWLDKPGQASAEDFFFSLEESHRLRALASNPLLLTLIVNIYMHSNFKLPNRRAEFYTECVKTLLSLWDPSRGIERHSLYEEETKRQLLEEIGWHFQKKNEYVFSENDLLQVIGNFLLDQEMKTIKSSEILNEILVEYGLLQDAIQDDPKNSQKVYKFLHQAFQEYFAAEYAIRNHERIELLSRRRDLRWEEVIILYADLLYKEDSIEEEYADATFLTELENNDDIFATHLALAGRCVAAISTPIEERAVAISTRLQQKLQETELSHACTLLAEALAEIGGATNEQFLLKMLEKDQISRKEIIDAIVKRGEPKLVLTLVEMTISSHSQSGQNLGHGIPKSTAIALRQTSEKKVMLKLAKMLDYIHSEPALFEAIADTLSIIGSRSITQKLLETLNKQEIGFALKIKVVQILGALNIAEHDVILELLDLLKDTSLNITLRQMIVETLARLGEKDSKLISDRLYQILKQEVLEWSIKGRILIVLSALGKEQLKEQERNQELYKIICNKSLEEINRKDLVNLIGYLKVTSMVEDVLLNLLQNEILESTIEIGIAEVLKENANRDMIPILVDLLSKPRDRDQQTADASIVRVFGHIKKDDSIIGAIRNFLTDEKFRNRLYLVIGIADVVGMIYDSEDTSSDLLSRLQSSPLCIFEAAEISILTTLYKLGDKSVRKELIEQFYAQKIDQLEIAEDEKTNMHKRLKQVLNTADDKDLITILREQLANDWAGKHDVHKQIVDIIGERDEAIETCMTTCEELINYLNDPEIKENIYDALWKISRRNPSLRIFLTNEGQIQVEKQNLIKSYQ